MRSNLLVHVVRSSSFAGVERYIADVANELARRGRRVIVVGGDRQLMPAALDGVDHIPAASTLDVVRSLQHLGRCAIVHAHMTAAEAAAVVTRPVTRAKVVSTRHFAQMRGRGVTRLMARGVQAGIAEEIAISEFVRSVVGPGSHVIPNGVRVSDPVLGQGQNILAMQRLEREKDTATVLRAFARAQLAADGWSLTVAGRGKDVESLSDLIRQLNLEDSVDMVGFTAQPERLRSEAAFFVSSAPAEPFGLSVVEAMAAGLAVLCADGGAHRETVGETGIFFTPHDVDECADGLRLLAHDEVLRHDLGRRARLRQQELFTVDRHVDELEKVYDSL